MAQNKETGVSVTSQIDLESTNANLSPEKKGTVDDQRDMFRMGKHQELRRNFRFVSIFGFSMILMASWETILGTSIIGLINGGTAGMIWLFLVAWIGFLAVNTSMAEMASMAPTSGGQYHWVSEFAPRKYQKFMSFIVGWFCVLGWQTGAANTAFLAGTQIQGLVVLNYPDYTPQRWHGTLLTFAVASFSVFFNTFLVKKLPLVEGIVLIIHIFGFFGVLITLWVLGPRGNASDVFTTFNNYGGWSSDGLSAIVGILAVMIPLLGADGAVHMSEELRDASKVLPQSMIATTVLNGAMGWIILITFCFVLGNLDEVINSPTGQPYVQVFYNATESYAGASVLSALVIFMAIFCNLSITATASRQLWSFARDQGIPGSSWFAYVRPGWDVPMNSIIVSFVVSCLLSLINIGSTIALNNITSLSLVAILASYIASIGCLFWRRLTYQPLLPAKFTFSRPVGLFLNAFSLLFLSFAFIFAFFPGNPDPTVEQMNWACLMFGGVMLFAILHYFVQARHVYDGPVEYVRKLV
ncbi:putative amino-acid permease PB24D3.02c [Cladophialophora carrionii]|uniref:Putative amino-acid permease PB24D3.02c n=1 Tax=Cladophialophora carrionii TaxID=86049 RepID=A0A1C1CGM8_9EURO|nr:putative amino-acid permease PB24D3.02c [Cladophialophora carrionii]